MISFSPSLSHPSLSSCSFKVSIGGYLLFFPVCRITLPPPNSFPLSQAVSRSAVAVLLHPERLALLSTPTLDAHIRALREALRVAEEQLKERAMCVVSFLPPPQHVHCLPHSLLV